MLFRKTKKTNMFIHPRFNFLVLIANFFSKIINFFYCSSVPSPTSHILQQNVIYFFRNWSLGSNIHEGILDAWNYQEYFNSLYISEIPNSASYLTEVLASLNKFKNCQYILIDVRSLFISAHIYQLPGCLLEALLIGVHLRKKHILPIVFCPDYEQVSDRLLATLVAGNYGYFLSLGQYPTIVKHSPHSRVVGPIAIFNKRILSVQLSSFHQREYDLFIGGSIYGRRTRDYTFLKEYFERKGFKVLFMYKSELSYSSYIDALKNSRITYVSSFHSSDPSILCAMGKVSEAASLGCVPCTQHSVAISQWFCNRKEFIGVDPLASLEDVASSIEAYLLQPKLLERVSSNCVSRAHHLARYQNIWNQIYPLIRQNQISNQDI